MVSENEITALIPIHDWSRVKGNLNSVLNLSGISKFNVVLIADSLSLEEQTDLVDLASSSQAKVQVIRFVDFNSAAKSRNIGLCEIHTKYLCFWDSDDLPIVEGYLSLMEQMNEKNLDIAIGQLSRVDTSDLKSDASTESNTKDLWDFGMDPGFTRILYRSEMISKNEFPLITLAEDLVFLCRVLLVVKKYEIYSTLVYEYRIGQPTQSTSKFLNPKDQFEAIGMLEDLAESERREIVKKLILLIRLKLILGLVKRIGRLDLSERRLALKLLVGSLRIRTVLGFIKLKSRSGESLEN